MSQIYHRPVPESAEESYNMPPAPPTQAYNQQYQWRQLQLEKSEIKRRSLHWRIDWTWKKADLTMYKMFYHMALDTDGTCYLNTEFFTLQRDLVQMTSRDNGLDPDHGMRFWPSSDKLTLVFDGNLKLRPFEDEGMSPMNEDGILDGLFVAKQLPLRQVQRPQIETGIEDVPALSKMALKRQLVLLPNSSHRISDRRFRYTWEYMVYRRIADNWLTEDEKMDNPTGTVVSLIKFLGKTMWWMQVQPPHSHHVDLEILYNAMTWFGWDFKFKNFRRLVPISMLTPDLLPLMGHSKHIQLSIVTNLPRPKDVDRALNFPFPHLVSEYLNPLEMRSRFKKWLGDLCSRNSLSYIGNQVLERGDCRVRLWDIYRLRSLYTKHFVSIPSCSGRDLEPSVPGLEYAQVQLATSIEQLFWKHKLQRNFGCNAWGKRKNPRAPRFHCPGEPSPYVPIWSGYYLGPSNAERRISTLMGRDIRCILIPLDRQYVRRASHSYDPTPPSPNISLYTLISGVLLLEDELNLILEDFECFVRPRLLDVPSTYSPGMTKFPDGRNGLDLLSDDEEASWRYGGSRLLDAIFQEHRENTFLKACADIRFLFRAQSKGWIS